MKKSALFSFFLVLVTALHAGPVDPARIAGAWNGKLRVGPVELTLVVNIAEAEAGHWKCTLDSPDQGAKGIPATVAFLSADSIAVEVKSLVASLRARYDGKQMSGTFTQMGTSLPITLSREAEQLRRPQEPLPPYPYSTKSATFQNTSAGATLAGTLTLPVGFTPQQKATCPVVVLVTGSGQQNRDEEVFGHKPFLVLADFLARKGIATLRYDDRAFGESKGGDLQNATTLDFFADAKAAISYLKDTERFRRVGMLGHSEGGNIAFMAGAEGLVDFVVSLAGMGEKGDVALTAQVNRILELSGAQPVQTVEGYREQAKAQHSAWLDWFIDYDPADHLRRIHCPVLALNGTSDCQVIADLNLAAIEKNLPKNTLTKVKACEGLNHLFQHCSTGLPTEYRQTEETLAPEVLEDIAAWILSLRQ